MLSTGAYNILTARKTVCERSKLCGQGQTLYVRSGLMKGGLLKRATWVGLRQHLVRWTAGGNQRKAELDRSLELCASATREAFASIARAEEIYQAALQQTLTGEAGRFALHAAGETLLHEVYPRICQLRDHPNLWRDPECQGLAALHKRFERMYGLFGEREAAEADWQTLTRALELSRQHQRLLDMEEKLGMQIPFEELGTFLAAFADGGVEEVPEAITRLAEAIEEREDISAGEMHLFLSDIVHQTSIYEELQPQWRPLLCAALEHELEAIGCTLFQRDDPEYQERIAELEEVSIDGKRYIVGEELDEGRFEVIGHDDLMLVVGQKNAAELGILEVARDAYDREIGVPRLKRTRMHALGWCALYERPADRAVDRAIRRDEREPYDERLEESLIEQFRELAERDVMPRCSLHDDLFVTESGELRWEYEPDDPVELDPAAVEGFFLEMARFDRERVMDWMSKTGVAATEQAARQRDLLISGETEDPRLLAAHVRLGEAFRMCVSDLRNDYRAPSEAKLLAVLRDRARECLAKLGLVACLPENFSALLLEAVLRRKRYRMKTRLFSRRVEQMRSEGPRSKRTAAFFHRHGIYHPGQMEEAGELLDGKTQKTNQRRSVPVHSQRTRRGQRRSVRGRVRLKRGN